MHGSLPLLTWLEHIEYPLLFEIGVFSQNAEISLELPVQIAIRSKPLLSSVQYFY